MDVFYASVEQRDHPAYRGRPVIMETDPQGGRGRKVDFAAISRQKPSRCPRHAKSSTFGLPMHNHTLLLHGRFNIDGRPCRRIAMLATFALWLLCLLPVPSTAEGTTHGDLVQNSFQQLLDHWGYHEWWSMWEQGTRQSRSAIPMDAFARKMDASPWRLACCDKRLRSLQITPVSSRHVRVSATLLFESKDPRPVERPYSIRLSFYLEEQEWRVDISGLGHP